MANKNTTTKPTQTQMYEDIIALLEGRPVTHGTTASMAIELCNTKIAQLAKKNNPENRKPSKEAQENAVYKEDLRVYLATLPDDSKGQTCTEILRNMPALYNAGYGNQKIAYLCKLLMEEGAVTSQVVKGKTLYRLA